MLKAALIAYHRRMGRLVLIDGRRVDADLVIVLDARQSIDEIERQATALLWNAWARARRAAGTRAAPVRP